ncbi:SDR family NAD(P)-dependent oxidoreductase [Actinomadura sp. 9N407]|uniref:SDR family NAD(P)-dependent oxidoreductase n=1 Tax=Actinomadura sp. 9N407 TaxID=3375154 RepID=UPI0037B2CAB4
MALAGAKLFVEEGAYVFILARRQEQFHRAFWLNARGTLFTVQKALPLINDNGSVFMTGSNASLGAFPGWSLYAGSKAVQQAWARVWLNELRERRIRVNVLTPGQVGTAKQEELFDEATRSAFESLIPRGTMGRPEEIGRALGRDPVGHEPVRMTNDGVTLSHVRCDSAAGGPGVERIEPVASPRGRLITFRRVPGTINHTNQVTPAHTTGA